MSGSESDARLVRTLVAGALLSGAAALPAAELSDPTRPSGRSISAPAPVPLDPADWRLTMVRIAPGNHSAVVNGEVVRVGETIGGARVVDIRPGRVVIDREGARLTLRPGAGEVRGERVVVRHTEDTP